MFDGACFVLDGEVGFVNHRHVFIPASSESVFSGLASSSPAVWAVEKVS